jgi:hypothetical protein
VVTLGEAGVEDLKPWWGSPADPHNVRRIFNADFEALAVASLPKEPPVRPSPS